VPPVPSADVRERYFALAQLLAAAIGTAVAAAGEVRVSRRDLILRLPPASTPAPSIDGDALPL
jgi:hypothetical protein